MANDFFNSHLPFVRKFEPSFLQRFAINVLSSGVLPKHVAIILDGNRRWAQQRDQKPIEGHERGFDTLAKALSWIRVFDIPEVTAYVFSIENLKRSQKEVDGLMNFMMSLFKKIFREM
ncbi:dehydrodolichyl diphosphate syntase complex subunit DHDDS-like isoform X2 [Dinothrombium tinctorium]|uniref:ditrans,polycis-polyprenyl diphosphate synthase [(2E,6E)-farnesyldiphosphate specific] n=1 Tax=Dinothrombium tinctorium TaxID=1965070 RepID=A0A3S3PW90_9ACAR|nr:dehydrodolichyl diphosphate syntase complex subunit DHDDS-like isoform X2 [Dinothrombium tinctorium]